MTHDHSPPTIFREAPPGPRGYPLVGVLPMLLRDPLKLFLSAAQRYGDVVSLPVVSQHFHLLNHPDHLKHVLQDNIRNYQKGATFKKLKHLLGEGLSTSKGDFWLRQRRLIQPAFHHQRLESMASMMTVAALDLVERWRTYATRSQPVDIVAEMMALTQQIIVTTMFSSDIAGDTQTVCHAFDVALKHLTSSLWLTALPDRLTPGHRRFGQALRTLDSVVYRIIEERRRDEGDRADLLSMLLQARDAETGEGMSDKQLRDEVMTMFLAGHETTATTLAWTWHMLAASPQIEKRLHDELDSVLGGRPPTFQDLPQLTYTRMVIDEVLRKYPSVWALFRTAQADDVIGGYPIPAGSVVIQSPYVLHRNSAFWEDPERFDPERFLPQRVEERLPYTYVPFGAGQRQCIGKNFALIEAQMILATVAQHYQLRSVSSRPVEPSIAVVLRPHPGNPLIIRRRSDRP